MTQRKSPQGGNQGGGENEARTAFSYPPTTTAVKLTYVSCTYFRVVPEARWKRIFCAFTGESIMERWSCTFWTVAEVKHG